MNNSEVTVKREVLSAGDANWAPEILWFVDCDGYSFGTWNTEQEARNKQTWLYEQLSYGWTAREIYHGHSGSTEVEAA